MSEVERFASAEALHGFVRGVLVAQGSSHEQASDVARALVDASLMGTDSHGVRLLAHYHKVLGTGRINAQPRLTFCQTGPATGILDADNGFGHHAGYAAIQHCMELAREAGIGAVSVINSSHFGAAGVYTLQAADVGLISFAFANSDSFVLPHAGVTPFHGTNPIAFAAPVPGERPFMLDMATSAVPWNKTQDRKAKGLPLPQDVAVDSSGAVTIDPAAAAALLPLGGQAFGHKGAGLAAMVEVMSAVITGMPYCSQLLSMVGPDWSTPRRLGQFYLVIDPERFVSRAAYAAGMSSYLASLRAVPPAPGYSVMSPGQREWSVRETRSHDGIPIFPALAEIFDDLGRQAAWPLSYLT